MSITVTPAYGRDYTSAAKAKSDWDSGKDFVLNSFRGSAYCSSADFPPSVTVVIRYAQMRKVTTAKGRGE